MIMNFGISLNAQQNTALQKQQFEKQMNAYITTRLTEKVQNLRQNPQMFENFEEYTTEDFRSIAREQLKSEYIQHNMKEYLNTYFSNPQAMVNTDTFVCDNGGFEQDFMYYKGYTGMFVFGSDSCTPYHSLVKNIPTIFIPAQLPTVRRFEIVTSGTDPLTGLRKVKFGNKALKINDKYNHNMNGSICRGDRGIDKIVKRFKVTNENRDFTIWYSVALENPTGHKNQQPFLNIKCDLAPNDELCFDADFLQCEKYYSDSICTKYMDVLDWSCHRFKIPKEYIDSIATLEITAADCGLRGHVGYAYIDGICEECDSSALGSSSLNTIDYISCYEGYPPEIATVCGRFTLPTISSNCGNSPDPWQAIGITVPGYDIENVEIYNNSKTFCFDFPISNFGNEDCLEIYAEIYFTNGTDTLPPQSSNLFEICKSKYEVVDCSSGGGGPIDTCNVVIDIDVGGCHSNGTGGDGDADQTPNISDDYYYVYVSLYDPESIGWSIDRDLVDPYPNENSIYTIADGVGDTVSMVLGPFLIQQGDWWMEFYLPGCNFSEYIEAPDYCSGCDKFQGAEIGNVANCLLGDKWNFTIKVPNDHSTPYNPLLFKLNNLTLGTTEKLSYNEKHIIGDFVIGSGCIVFLMEDENNSQCKSGFTICPPKPCNDACKDLDVYVEKTECIFDKRFQQYTGYYAHIDISGIDDKEQKACISYTFPANPTQSIQWGSLSNGFWKVGPFDSDIYLTVTVCPKKEVCPCGGSKCYKTIYIPKPDCEIKKGIKKGGIVYRSANAKIVVENTDVGELTVIPNPFKNDEIILHSTLKHTVYEIFDLSGKRIQTGDFEGIESRVKIIVSQGIYFIRYIDKSRKPAIVKIIKL